MTVTVSVMASAARARISSRGTPTHPAARGIDGATSWRVPDPDPSTSTATAPTSYTPLLSAPGRVGTNHMRRTAMACDIYDKVKLTAAPLFVLLCVGCASVPSAPTGPVNAEFVLAPGDVKDISGASVKIQFQGVFGDSRCPADALCIQGGDALVRIDVLPQDGASATYDLHTGNMQPVRHGDLTIALETLMPYPFSSGPIQTGDYRATLRVTR
jgi:hypothetical protein